MLFINPVVRWAIDPSDADRIAQLDGAAWPKGLGIPEEDDIITLGFLVDPQTRRPVPVRVSGVWARWLVDHHEIAIRVTRQH